VALMRQALKRRLVTGSLWALVGRGLGAATLLATNALLARLLPPDEMAAYFLLFSMVNIAALIAQFGLPQAMVRFIAESLGTNNQGEALSVIRSGFGCATVVGGIIAVVVGLGGEAFFSRLLRLPQQAPFLLAGCWIMALAWQAVQAGVFNGFRDLRNSVIFGGTASNLLYALSLCSLLWRVHRSTLNEVLWCAAVSAAVGVLAGALVIKGKTASLLPGGNLPPGRLLRTSFPILIGALATILQNQSDLWVIGFFGRPDDVAAYGAASRLAATISLFLMVANTVLSPVIAEFSVQGRTPELERLLRNASLAAFLPSLLPLILFLAFGSEAMGLLFGDFYRAGGGVLGILAVGMAFNVWAGSCGLTLMMTGNQITLMLITIFCGLLTVVGSVLLAKLHGMTGVALASSGGLIVQNILMLMFAKRKTGMWTHAQFAFPELRALWMGRLS
jgi:O-antigen/teichoic acid export membrane protein